MHCCAWPWIVILQTNCNACNILYNYIIGRCRLWTWRCMYFWPVVQQADTRLGQNADEFKMQSTDREQRWGTFGSGDVSSLSHLVWPYQGTAGPDQNVSYVNHNHAVHFKRQLVTTHASLKWSSSRRLIRGWDNKMFPKLILLLLWLLKSVTRAQL